MPWENTMNEQLRLSYLASDGARESTSANYFVAQGLTQYLRETELMKRSPFLDMELPRPEWIADFRETRIRHATTVGFVDICNASQVSLDDLLARPFSWSESLGMHAQALMQEGKVPGLMAGGQFAEAEAITRRSLQMLDHAQETRASIKSLQATCMLQDIRFKSGTIDQAQLIEKQIIQLAAIHLAEIPDYTE
jgi:hypothetical protein